MLRFRGYIIKIVKHLSMGREISMPNQLNQSRFYMWRAVVAMVHADGVVTPHELNFINRYISDLSLSREQLQQIADDLKIEQDVYQMFSLIKTPEDKRDFFALARALSWCDGDFDAQEEKILEQLELNDSSAEQWLQESREVVQEIELTGSQWAFKTERSKNLFGFLNALKGAA